MKNICLFLLLITCVFITRSNAQSGYIITKKNDTIRGEYKLSAFGRPKLKATGQTEFKSVNTDTVKEYQLTKDGSIWVVRILPITTMNFISKPQFVQWLEHGKINLYEQMQPAGMRLITWYVGKGTDSLFAVKTDDIAIAGGGSKKSREEKFINLMSDQPDIVAAFRADTKFSYDKIRAYVKRYNAAVATVR